MKVREDIKSGIYQGIPNESYHEGPGASKSGLWTIYSKTPAHYKFPPPRDEETTQAIAAKDFGTATHLAILEPEQFEVKVMRGPDDRRGNKWKDASEGAILNKQVLLTAGDYDRVMQLRDTVHSDEWVNRIITTGNDRMIEATGYWIDDETGELCRCRPDLYRANKGIILDVKSAESAHPDAFARAVINYGYHAQEAWYSDGWRALGQNLNGFAFLVWEKKPPFAFAVYELPPSIVDEGRAIMRKALATYADCRATGEWRGYASGVQELPIKRWAYRLTEAPSPADEQVAA